MAPVMFFLLHYLFTIGSHLAEEISESEFLLQACDQTIKGHDLSSKIVNSQIECVVYCVNEELCHTVTYNKQEISTKGETTCKMKREATLFDPYQIWSKKDMCIMSLSDVHTSLINTSMVAASVSVTQTTTETTELPTSSAQLLTTTNSSSQSYIIGAVETVTSQCNPYSYFDIVVLTQDGVYIYDDVTHLYSSPGPCIRKRAFSDVFNAYGDLPNIEDIDAILSFNTDRVEIYANNYVWSVIFAGLSQFQEGGYPMTYSDHLKKVTSRYSITQFPNKPVWGTLRARYGTQERYFFENGNIYYYANFVPYFEEIIDWDEDLLNVNNVNINPWTDLPTNVVDVMLIPSQYDDYIVITSDLKVHEYQLDYSLGKHLEPTKKLVLKGDIMF